MNTVTALADYREAAFNAQPRRLKRVVEYAMALGRSATPYDVALESIEEALWGDGLLPIGRASQRRAWTVAFDGASAAYDREAALSLARIADDARAKFGPGYAAAYVTAWACCTFAADEEIAAAVGIKAGRPWCPIRRAREAFADGFRGELESCEHVGENPVGFVIAGYDNGVTVIDLLGDPTPSEPDRCPPKLAPEAFDLENEPGLLGDIARWSQTFAFKPVREFAQPAALATLSALFGRRWATPTGLGLNLYIVAIAETGGGKDALIGAPRRLLSDAGFRHILGPGDFSSDAAIEKSLRVRPAQLMPLDEFGKLAQAMMGRNAPSFAKLAAKALLEIYPRSQPGSEWTGKARASDEHDAASTPICAPTLSLLGVSTPEGFFDGMSQATLDDGFLNRLTVVRAGNAGERQHDASRLIPPPELIDAIRSAYRAAAPQGNMGEAAARDAATTPKIRIAAWAGEDALEALRVVERWEDEAIDAGRSGVAGRAAEQVQKIATLRALARDPAQPAVSAADIAWAFQMVQASIEAIETGARAMMAGSDFEALVQAIERAVIMAGPNGIAMSHLVRAKGVSKADDRMVEAALKRLETSERIWRMGRKIRERRPDERLDG